MIISSVIVENFRSFYGEQTINFSVDKIKNTTIVYALNGVGKTNLLNAILWCLHGTFSPGFKRPDDLLNWEAARRNRKSFHVTVEFEEGNSSYLIKRSGGDQNNFKLFKVENGNSEQIDRNASLFINSIIPKDMAGYFINDGEGGDLVVNSQGMISVQRSIRDILGFKVAEKTLDDLLKIKAELRNELRKFDVDSNLAESEERLEVFENSIRRNEKELEENRVAHEDYKLQIDDINEKLEGTNLNLVRKLQVDRSRAEKDLANRKSELSTHLNNKISLIREYSWVAFAHKMSNEALDFIDEAELEGKIPAPYNIQLVNDILTRTECICGATIKPGTEAYEIIKSLTEKAADPDLLNRLQKARSRLTAIKTLAPQAMKRMESNFKSCDRALRDIKFLKDSITQYSIEIKDYGDRNVEALENNRRVLNNKKDEAYKTIIRKEHHIDELKVKKEKLKVEIKKMEGLSPRAKVCRKRITLVESIEQVIILELKETEDSIQNLLEEKINLFLDKYLRQDYKVKMTPDFKIGLTDRNGRLVPPGGGQGAILSFIYISSLISIARERRDLDSNILTPGAIAPLIFDAPFSNLDPSYAPNVAKELPKLVDQLIIFMYPDAGKNVDKILKEEGKLGREYYLTEEIAGSQGDRVNVETIEIQGEEVPVTTYDASFDRVIINEAANYV